MLDARPEVSVQGIGFRRTTHGTGAAPGRTPVRRATFAPPTAPVLRQRISTWLLCKLHQYLLELQPEVLPKSPSGAAVRYALNQWEALTRFLEDGELKIDNGATERANRDIALGRCNWTFFGSDNGGKTAGRVTKLYRFLQAVRRRAVCVVPRRALAHPDALHHPARRITSPQLATGDFLGPKGKQLAVAGVSLKIVA